MRTVENEIKMAVWSLTKGKTVRVKLADLRKAVPHIAKDTLDSTLKAMQIAGKCMLYKNSSSLENNTTEYKNNALYIAGEPRHILYMT